MPADYFTKQTGRGSSRSSAGSRNAHFTTEAEMGNCAAQKAQWLNSASKELTKYCDWLSNDGATNINRVSDNILSMLNASGANSSSDREAILIATLARLIINE